MPLLVVNESYRLSNGCHSQFLFRDNQTTVKPDGVAERYELHKIGVLVLPPGVTWAVGDWAVGKY